MMGLRALSFGLCVLAACEIRIAERADDDDNLTQPVCGNGVLEGSEVCDDGNTADTDGCNATCTSDEQCGNGVVDEAVQETCDDGNLLGGDGCSADCKSDESCGNAVIDLATGETCDDGDLQGGDGCSANCQSNESCGNGIHDPGTTPPEECDGGPGGSSDCDVNCTTAVCGDFTVNTKRGEQCDAGPNGNAQCDNNCTTAFCGDGTTNTFRNEQCDDGNGTTTDACINCVNAFCGDGFVRSGTEQCDDANANVNDACTTNCQAAFCGDGFLRAGVEACDDGNQNNDDGCNAACQFEPRTYLVTDVSQLVNQDSFCDGIGVNRYDGCQNIPTGFMFNDASPFTPSSIQVEFDNGVNCVGAPETKDVQINGTSAGSFTTSPGDCVCTPTQVLNTFQVANPGSYVLNGTNTILLSASPNCYGYSFDLLGAYARITVFP